MMASIAHILRTLAGWAVEPFTLLDPRWALIVIAGLATAFVLLVFGRVANQNALRSAKDRMQAALLGLVLFRHDTAAMFRQERRLIVGALAYMGAGLKPLALVILPMMLLITALGLFYGYRPLEPGESSLLTVEVAEGNPDALMQMGVGVAPGLTVETPALRIPSRGQVCWRIKAEQPGTHRADIRVGSETYSKSIVVGPGARQPRLSPIRSRGVFREVLLESAEAPLPGAAPVERIGVDYPPGAVDLGRWRVHWLLFFTAAAMAWGMALKGLFRVEL